MINSDMESNSGNRLLEKSFTGIDGLDDVTGGGLPQGRPTLICGAAGCGKTIFSMEFIIHGA
ncbi:MAG: ATPase domain-containing protein, partial [Methanobacterium sp.]